MKRRKIIRVLGIGLLVIGVGLLYTYAQQTTRKSSPPRTANTDKLAGPDADDDTGTPTGDDPWNEMNSLVSAYYSNDGIMYKGSIKVIDDNEEKEKVLEVHPFDYSFFNGSFTYSLDSMEFVNQQDYLLVADHRARLIALSAINKSDKKQSVSRLFDIKEFRKMMQKVNAHAIVTQLGNEKILTIDSLEDPQMQGYSIYYDPQTYKIHKMLIGMERFSSLNDEEDETTSASANVPPPATVDKDAPDNDAINIYSYYVEIDYTETHLLSLKPGEFNPVHKFLKISDGKVELQPAYNDYQLVNTGSSSAAPNQPAVKEE